MKIFTSLQNRIDKYLKNFFIIIFWILIWTFFSNVLNNSIILPNPIQVISTLITLLKEITFWVSIKNTIFNLSLGLLIASISSILLSIIALKFTLLENLIQPAISFFKSVPIVCFIILIISWDGTKNLGLYISFIMGFPIIFETCIFSYKTIPKDIINMGKSFKANNYKMYKYIYWPHSKERIRESIIKTSSLMFKAVIAAEVIGLTKNSIGEAIYYSKIYLDTSQLIAWTVTIISISIIYEKLLGKLLGVIYDKI